MTWAQNAQVKDIRQTYLWDVTLSMKGQGKDQNGNKNPNIWEIVKKALIEDIQAISDESTEIVVIPFQHKVLDVWKESATEVGKDRIIKRIQGYDIPLAYTTASGTKTTMTYLGPPLEYCMQSIFTADKRDILKFMTDGVDEQGNGYFQHVLGQWCDTAREKDAYGYFIILTEAARIGWEEFKENHEEICRWTATPETTQILSFTELTPQNLSFNVRDDYGKSLQIKFSKSGKGNIAEGYKVRVSTMMNPYMAFDEEITLKSDFVEIQPRYLMKQEDMKTCLSTDSNEIIYFQIEPAEGMEGEKFYRTTITSNMIACEMINKPEMTVKFHVR